MTSKQQLLEQLLDQGMVLVALDARKPGVEIPPALRGDPQLRLNLSYRFGLPLFVDDWGVRATLTFGNVPYECRLPWSCIFLIVSHVSGQPVLFPDDIPMELLSQPSGENKDGSVSPMPGPRSMSPVPASASAAVAAVAMTDVASPTGGNAAPRSTRRHHLSLVVAGEGAPEADEQTPKGDEAPDVKHGVEASREQIADALPHVAAHVTSADATGDTQIPENGKDEPPPPPPASPSGRSRPSRGHLRLVK